MKALILITAIVILYSSKADSAYSCRYNTDCQYICGFNKQGTCFKKPEEQTGFCICPG